MLMFCDLLAKSLSFIRTRNSTIRILHINMTKNTYRGKDSIHKGIVNTRLMTVFPNIVERKLYRLGADETQIHCCHTAVCANVVFTISDLGKLVNKQN